MKHGDFKIGLEFLCGSRLWRCTDVGSRVAIAVPLEDFSDPSWYAGPPYVIAEFVFDENDMPACELPEKVDVE